VPRKQSRRQCEIFAAVFLGRMALSENCWRRRAIEPKSRESCEPLSTQVSTAFLLHISQWIGEFRFTAVSFYGSKPSAYPTFGSSEFPEEAVITKFGMSPCRIQAGLRTSRVASKPKPNIINARLNHCASLRPNARGGLMRQNSTTKRAIPPRIKYSQAMVPGA
jgi:hypothetical protein